MGIPEIQNRVYGHSMFVVDPVSGCERLLARRRKSMDGVLGAGTSPQRLLLCARDMGTTNSGHEDRAHRISRVVLGASDRRDVVRKPVPRWGMGVLGAWGLRDSTLHLRTP